jgi:leucyl aminopeptidase (aminopeptidase T)
VAADEQRETEAERPEWLPDKFTSPEELARSYSEAEQRLVQLQSEVERQRSEFSEAINNLGQIQQEAPPQRYDPQQDPLLQQYQMAVDNGDAQAMLAIQLELNRQIARQEAQNVAQQIGPQLSKSQEDARNQAITLATERVARNYDNWDDLAPEIGEFLQARPHWIPEEASVDRFEQVLIEAANTIEANKMIRLVPSRSAAVTRRSPRRACRVQAPGRSPRRKGRPSGNGSRASTSAAIAASWVAVS